MCPCLLLDKNMNYSKLQCDINEQSNILGY